MRVFFKLLCRLPLRVLSVIGSALLPVAYDVVHSRRRLAAANLAQSFPERSAAERAAILKQSYRNLGELIAVLDRAGTEVRASCPSTRTGDPEQPCQLALDLP